MLKDIQRTVKHTVIIALGKICSKLVGFILLPIYTKEISVTDYGVLGLLEVFELIGAQIFSIGLHQALLRWYSISINSNEKKKVLFSAFIFISFLSILSILVVISTRHSLSVLLFDKAIYGDFFIYVIFSISFLNIAKISQTVLRAEEKTLFYSISVFVQFLLSLVLNIYFVAILKMGVKGVLLASSISSGFLFLILLPYQLKRMVVKIDFHLINEMMAFSYPFIFTAIGATILNLGDRYLLTKLSSLTEVGLYSLGYKFSNILKIFLVDAFTLGLPIVAWKIVKNDNQPKRFFSKALTYSVFLLIWCGLTLSAYSKGIIHVFALNKDYWDANLVVPYLIVGVIFLGMSQNFYFVLQIPRKTKNISLIIATAAILNILLNFIFIPTYGMMASAIITMVSQLWAMLFAFFQVKKYYPIKFEIMRILLMFLVATGLYFLTMLFDDYSIVIRIILKGFIVFSFPFILFVLKFYEPVELESIKKISKKLMNLKTGH